MAAHPLTDDRYMPVLTLYESWNLMYWIKFFLTKTINPWEIPEI